jgi:hypothetical protein
MIELSETSARILRYGALVGGIHFAPLINTSWFLCGETAPMQPKAFEGRSPPVPIEIMVFLILGWLFLLIGDYREMRLKKS